MSHSHGELPVASCVALGPDGFRMSDYRRFNIRGVAPGDDYAAMRQALERRYARLRLDDGRLPEVVLIDGGAGQLHEAARVFDELQIEGVTIAGIAKGATRRPGLESLFLLGRSEPFILPGDSPALHLIQQVRDEAHRFAISAHRQRRAGQRRASVIEGVPSDKQCVFGKWLDGSMLTPTEEASHHYKTVKERHAEFHKTAARVVELVLAGKKSDAVENDVTWW